MARRAIVTGSDSGIGRAAAVLLAREGFDIGITWQSDRAGAEETAREVQRLGRRAILTHLDMASADDAADTVEFLAGELGGLDLFVNDSREELRHPLLEYPLEEWRRAVEVNLTGPFACSQRAARVMVEAPAGGRIVNVTSVHEHIPLAQLTREMALELSRHGIAANSVAPGESATEDDVAAAIVSLALSGPGRAVDTAVVVDGELAS
jgi:NAD(P)-dependent dehydrogenase (short-subunit alcohol dehydrogenase family)